MKRIIGIACCLFSLCIIGASGRAPARAWKQQGERLPLAPRAAFGPKAAAQAEKPKSEKFSALAYLPSGAGRAMGGSGATANVDVYVKSYTTNQEANVLGALLLDKGPDALLDALQKADPIGKITLTGRVGFYDLKLIRSRPTETGRQIIAVGDRPIGFLELYYSGHSRDYEFGILTLNLTKDKKGKEKGEGVLVYAAKVKVLDGKKLEIENYGVDPVRLMGVRKL